MANAYEDAIKEIFDCRDKLVKLDKGTLEFGFEWKPEDGVALFGESIVSKYYQGLFAILYPNASVKKFDEKSPKDSLAEYAKEFPSALVIYCGEQFHPEFVFGYAYLSSILPEPWLGRVITSRQLGEFLPYGDRETKIMDYFRKTNYPTQDGNKKRIEKAAKLFEDSLSRETYIAILKRYLLKSDTLIPVCEGTAYFDNFFQLGDAEIVVDCGAYTGDTLELYINKIQKSFAGYYAFEPDPVNFQELEKTKEKLPANLSSRVVLLRKAVGHTPKTLKFKSMGAPEARVDDTGGDIEVESVPLDLALQNVKPTFIKMDLEGFEAFALLGARNIIRNSRPVMAICVYHNSFDFWELPLLIASFAKDYKFFLRAYHEVFEYVLYCVPNERLIIK